MFTARLSLVLSMVFGSTLVANAQQSDETPTEEVRKLWMQRYAHDAAAYEMFRLGENKELLELVKTPLLTFTNPIRIRDTHGAAYVWTSDGRPEIVGAIWSVISPQDAERRHVSHEFHSLSLAPIVSTHEPRTSRRGVVPDWNVGEAGIERKDIPQADRPVPSPLRRLTQMRRLARRFVAHIPEGTPDGAGSLRLLAQPLYRYDSDKHGVIDGALFAYVMGTDPELILLIEAVGDDKDAKWTFSAAPLSNLPMFLTVDENRVWECPRAQPFVGHLPHFMYWGVSLHGKKPTIPTE